MSRAGTGQVEEESETRLPWDGVRELFRDFVRSELAPWGSSTEAHLEQTLAFALGRFDEGVGFVRYFEQMNRRPGGDVLDLGTGTGGVALAFANCPCYRVSAIDIGQNRILRKVSEATGLPVHYALANGLELPFRDKSFDVVFSNSVIEHVGDPLRQEQFAREIARVGVRYFVQTPNRWFPVEHHLLTPLIHFLPPRWQRRLVNKFTIWEWIARPRPDQRAFFLEHYLRDIRLLDSRAMRRLFPGARIIRERFLGLTKSLIAVK